MTLYVWQVLEPDTSEWNIVSAYVAALSGHVPLVSTRLHVAELLEPYARAHSEGTGKHVRLARYEDPEILRIIPRGDSDAPRTA